MTATVHQLHGGRPPNVVKLTYRPRREQRRLHREAKRFNVWVCHRRFGKTVAVVNELQRELIFLGRQKRERPRAAYIAPFYRQAKRVAWDYVRHFAKPIPNVKPLESELSMLYPWGARLNLYGADNPDSLRGEYFDIVAIDEVAQVSPRVWTEIVRPALADREGRAIFIGTPRGRLNLFHRLYHAAANAPGWTRALYTVDDTQVIPDKELAALRSEMSEDEYRQEFLCDWNAATPGSYYARYLDDVEKSGRIRSVPYDRTLPTVTSWDFGLRDPTVIAYWQLAGAEIRCIGCDAIADLSLPEIIAQVKATRPYSYVRHLVPHDARKRDGDQYGAPERMDIMAQHGFTPDPPVPTASIAEGIEAVRRGLGRVVFDKDACEVLLEALRLYRSEYDDINGVYRPKPVHDWTSHYADAVRTYFQATDGRSLEWGNQSEFDLVDQTLERGVI